MSNLIQVTPFLLVKDMEKALAFFVDTLGFEQPYRMHNYAYVGRDGVGFRLLERKDGAQRGDRRIAHYIDVRDVDALYAELKPRLDLLPTGDVYGPVDQDYGQRELMVLGPDGDCIAFGQAIAREA